MHTSSIAVIGLALLASCSPRPDTASPEKTGSVDTVAVAPPAPAAASDTARSAPPPAVPAQTTPTRPQAAPAGRPPSSTKPVPPEPTAPKPAAAAAPTPADPYHPAPRDTLDNDTYQGWKQFELNCSRCHGEYAVGTSFAPALVVSLKADGAVPTKEAFITTVCAGRPDKGMPAWCALGLEISKIEQIYLYAKGRADGRIAAGRPGLRQ